MAVSQFDHNGLLHLWRIHMQENVWRFNQINGVGVQNVAEDVYIQPDRDNLARALDEAWQMVSGELAYFPQPTWYSERIPLDSGHPYWLQSLTSKYRKLITFGQRNTSLIAANVAIVYSDADGDGVNDTATISQATTFDADEIQVFFRVADGADTAGNYYWRIQPLTVTSNGVTATITGQRALFVKPSTYTNVPYDPTDPNSLARNNADSQTAADFVTTVDIYRVYNDTTTTVTLVADPIYTQAIGSWDADVTYAAQAWIEDGENGIFRLRQSTNASCPRFFSHAILYYKSGLPLVNGLMDNLEALALSRLANTYTPYELDCPFNNHVKDRYVLDREITIADGQTIINNPFGIMTGQVYAWQTVTRRLRQVSMGGKL